MIGVNDTVILVVGVVQPGVAQLAQEMIRR